MATLVAASSQPKSGVGSLAETNRLLGNSAPTTTTSSSGGRDTLPAGVAYQTFNPDGSVRTSQTASQKTASDKAAIANGTDTPIGVGGELKNQDISQIGVSSKPIDTTQPSPTKVNATPFTQGAAGAGAGAGAPPPVTTPTPEPTAAQQGHAAATASGSAAPQTAGPGMSSATSTMRNMPQSYTSPAPIVQAYQDATQKLTDDYNKAMSTQGQGESLVQQYQDFTKQLGIPALNTELMNMKNIIDGTEDDVRNEVTKAGGFATDSQVLAMTNARNKTMIQNYNNLLQTRSDMQQQVQTMVGLAAQDRAYMSQQIDRQLNFDQQQVSFADKALTNAQNSIQQSIATYGAKSVLQQALATGDPTAVARINATMGNGFDLHTAAAHPTLDEQYKQLEIQNLQSEIHARNNPAPKPQSQAQVLAQGYAQRANAANATISALGSQFTSLTAVGGFLPTILQSSDRQAYEQAKREFVNAVLRPESGASISPSEFDSASKEYFPQQGDSSEAVRNKAVDRQLKINSLQQQGTNNSVAEAGQIVNYGGKEYTVDTNGDMTAI